MGNRGRASSPVLPRHSRYPLAAPQPVAGVHGPPAGWVKLEQLERSLSGAVQEARVLGLELARGHPVHARREPRAAHAEPLTAVELDVRAHVRVKGTHPALQLAGAQGGVEQAVAGLDLLRVRDPLVGLLAEPRLGVERLDEELAAERGQARSEAAVVVVGAGRLPAPGGEGARAG